jgi:hypothetical protein
MSDMFTPVKDETREMKEIRELFPSFPWFPNGSLGTRRMHKIGHQSTRSMPIIM